MSDDLPRTADVVIVGAGLAGASTAFHLAARGVRDIVLLEREAAPGVHASGKNAGLVRRLLDDGALDALAIEGAALLARPPEALSRTPLVRRTGSVLVVPEADAAAWEARAARAGARRLTRAERTRLAPELSLEAAGVAFHTPDDGIAEPRDVLRAWLAGAVAGGARVVAVVEARALLLEGGRVAGIETSRGRIETRCVVDASGPWAGALARRALGASARAAGAPDLRSHRRHIFTARARGGAARDPALPFLWDVAGGLYVRPATAADAVDGSTVMISPCDEEQIGAGADGVGPDALRAEGSRIEPARAVEMGRKLAERTPALASLEIVSARACLRAFGPEGRLEIGPSREIPGLVHVAGLGGHGLTMSGPVGALGALAVTA